jgi:GMP synthase (glutamine-hydrolysing)
MERGFYSLELTEAGHVCPLFAGISPEHRFYESHYCEIKILPPGFELLASSPECRIQAMRHRERPLFSTQFHPEDYNERFPDGRTLLSNFLSERILS